MTHLLNMLKVTVIILNKLFGLRSVWFGLILILSQYDYEWFVE